MPRLNLPVALALSAGLVAQPEGIPPQPKVEKDIISMSVVQPNGMAADAFAYLAARILGAKLKKMPAADAQVDIVFAGSIRVRRQNALGLFRCILRMHGFNAKLVLDGGVKRYIVERTTRPRKLKSDQLQFMSAHQLLAKKPPTKFVADIPVTTSLDLKVADASLVLAVLRNSRLLDEVKILATADQGGVILQGEVPALRKILQRRALIDVPTTAPALRLEQGFRFTEGPAWHPDGYLLFSDIPANRIHRYDPAAPAGERLSIFLEPSERANGLLVDADGHLLACQGGARQLVRIGKDKAITVLADKIDGKRLNSPNDLALDDAGGIYFTDPRYGKTDDMELEVMGVYYRHKDGDLQRVIDTQKRPNGIVFDAPRKRLLVAEPDKDQILSYPVEGPGRLGRPSVLFTSDRQLDGRGPDGMVVDPKGLLYATYRSVLAIDPQGRIQKRIPVAEQPSNCTLGDKDGKTLYITARTGLYRYR